MDDDRCRECGLAEETGAHIALVCREMEDIGSGRRFGSWEQADDPKRVIRKRKELDESEKQTS